MTRKISESTEFLSDVTVDGDIIAKSGAKAGGVLLSTQAQTGNTTTTETSLLSYSVLGGILAVDNELLWFHIVGLFTNNANTKTVRVKFAGTTIMTYAAAAGQGVWRVDGKIKRITATTQRCFYEVYNPLNGDFLTNIVADTATLANANTFQVTGQGTATNDVKIDMAELIWYPANS